jgi:heme exporter protein A
MLSVRSLSCRRAGRSVFRDLSFDLAAGDCLLVTGPNGSGKSSLLRLLSGLLEPAGGQIQWRGGVAAETLRGEMLYIGHHDAVKPALTLGETLAYWCALRGTIGHDPVAALAAVGLGGFADRSVRRLSAGQKRRLSLARLYLFPATLWLLDEPGTSLDRQGMDVLRIAIEGHRAHGGIAIVASHEELGLAKTQHLAMGDA